MMKMVRVVCSHCGPISVMLASLAVLAPATGASAGGVCENEARRLEQGSTLADCRAYELVTPPAKDSGEPQAVVVGFKERPELEAIRGAHAAIDGNGMAWDSEYSLPGSSSVGLDYLSTRGPEGWSSENAIPPQSVENGLLCPNLLGMVAWSADLSRGVLADGDAQEGSKSFFEQGFECGHDEPRLATEQPAGFMEMEGFQNLFVRDNTARAYQLVNVTPSAAPTPKPTKSLQEYYPANFLASSADLSHVVFEEELPLDQEAEKLTPRVEEACKKQEAACWEGHDDLYEWSEGESPAVRLVSVLPEGKAVEGRLAGSTRNVSLEEATKTFVPVNIANVRHAVSADGSRVFFEAGGKLYVRENGGQPQSALGPKGECSEAKRACTIQIDAPRGGSGAGGGGKWMAANAEGTKVFFADEASAGLTADTTSGSGANLYEYDLPAESGKAGRLIDLTPSTTAGVLGVSGTSEDGSYVYFVASGALTGSQQNSRGATAEAEQPNLYLSHDGTTTFIATLGTGDLCDWTSNTGCIGGSPLASGLTARVSANGLFVGFNSTKSLTGYDNIDTVTAEPDDEVFLYEAATNGLNCVSCNPEGPPVARGAAIRWPAEADTNAELRNAYPQRNVSDAGQVFFESSEALLLADTNGQRDVYEYEHGSLSLISSGTSEAGSYFLDATPDGSDVFFATAQPLLARDTDTAYDIYDARIGGGFAEPAAPGAPCAGEACRGSAPSAQAFGTPISVDFGGAGNVRPTTAESTQKNRKAKALTRKQRLARALKACSKRRLRRQRERCRRQARRRYGARAASAGLGHGGHLRRNGHTGRAGGVA